MGTNFFLFNALGDLGTPRAFFVILIRFVRFNRALSDFKKALGIDPDNPDYQKLVDDLEEK